MLGNASVVDSVLHLKFEKVGVEPRRPAAAAPLAASSPPRLLLGAPAASGSCQQLLPARTHTHALTHAHTHTRARARTHTRTCTRTHARRHQLNKGPWGALLFEEGDKKARRARRAKSIEAKEEHDQKKREEARKKSGEDARYGVRSQMKLEASERGFLEDKKEEEKTEAEASVYKRLGEIERDNRRQAEKKAAKAAKKKTAAPPAHPALAYTAPPPKPPTRSSALARGVGVTQTRCCASRFRTREIPSSVPREFGMLWRCNPPRISGGNRGVLSAHQPSSPPRERRPARSRSRT